MNVTFKQLEAFIAVCDHGTFDGAARHLGLAQSAISRQIQELEQWFGFDLFDRTGRTAKPNAMAREVVAQARFVLLQRGVFESCLMSSEVVKRKLRIGITELTAMAWLSSIIQAISREYPQIVVEPVVEMSAGLKDLLLAGRLDVVVLPDAFVQEGLVKRPLQAIANRLYCSADLKLDRNNVDITLFERHTLLFEGKKSGSGMLVSEWLKANNVKTLNLMSCNSIVAMLGLTISGLGVAFIPPMIAASCVQSGQLIELQMHPEPPCIPYVVVARSDSFTPVLRRISEIIGEVCSSASTVSMSFGIDVARGV
ncbi:LysR family transcriptional regulator [Pseudomonas sp. LB-090624]|uniref:LysR family transcriptional regulator n=1 Tax=Pseudomonas sp. LB-090624 TaxID=2213079 RepID=UPI000D879E8E|nr:LysR family transcriptional regulator [Pseudomonas sp. LB-090624]PYB78902.1 LysR family transcriptional regulator [Pseudomonas sp. LB-090624]